MTIISGFLIISLCFALIYLLGLFTFITDHVENKCEMTYMFQYPQFVQISMKTHPRYNKYGLYAYSEGRFTADARDMRFEGIPVLFVPGNAGSYKQVRSLASVALRKALSDRPGFHFDYFTVDLNDELSGLNGALLRDQLEYVNSSVYTILDLYRRTERPPKSVVLIGHSMGGVILRSLLSTLPSNSSIAPLLITLATPHVRVPVIFDTYMSDFYNNLQNPSDATTTISVAGGYNDFLVPSYLSNLKNDSHLYIVTNSVPRVWLSTDHLCILWCKQLVLAINRALFDSVDLRTKQLAVDNKRLYRTFHHHLVHNSGTNVRLIDRYVQPIISLDNRGEWIENLYRQYSLELPNVKHTHWYMIRHVELPQHQTATILALNVENEDWVYACPAIHVRGQSRICIDGRHLTQESSISPSFMHKRRIVDVDMHDLKNDYSQMTHVVVKVAPNDDPVTLHVDVHNSKQRTLNISLPYFFSLKKYTIIADTEEKAIRYNLIFPELRHVVQSYKLFIEPTTCSRTYHHATASLKVPWANKDLHAYITNEVKEFLHLRLHSFRPFEENRFAEVKLTLDPTCRYRISVRASLLGTLGQLARFYSGFLVANVATVVLLGLRHQLKTMGSERRCCFLLTAVKEGAKPFYAMVSVRIAHSLLNWEPLYKISLTLDWVTITNEGLDFQLLPLLLYICSVGIVCIVALALSVAVVISESTIQKGALVFLARTFTGTIMFSDYLISGLQKLPVVVAIALIALTLSTCGGLALCVGAAFYFLKLTQMSQELAEQFVWTAVKKLALRTKMLFKKERREQKVDVNKTNTDSDEKKEDSVSEKSKNTKETSLDTAIFFHFTVFILWLLVTALCIPSVLTWAHNFRYSKVLSPDPSFLPGIILCVCAIPLWQLDLPRFNRKYYKLIANLVFALAVCSLLYGLISWYRLTYLLTSSIVVVVLHQVFAPSENEDEEGESRDDTYAERVKAKWE